MAVERNLQLYADYQNGMKRKDIASKYGISLGRTDQIIKVVKYRYEHGIPQTYDKENQIWTKINNQCRFLDISQKDMYEKMKNGVHFRKLGKKAYEVLKDKFEKKEKVA